MAEVLNKKQLFDEKDGVRENFYPITHTDAVLMPDGASLTSIIELLQRDIANIGKTVLEPRGIKLTLTQYANVPENITSDAAIRQYTASHSEIWKSTMSADKNFPVIWKRYKYQYSDNTWDEDFKYELCGSILEGKDGLGYEEIFYYDNKEATPPSIADVNAQATKGYNDKGINFQEDGFLPNPIGNSGTRGWYSSRPTLKPNTAIYSSKRVKTAGVWGRFSAPSLCMEYDNTMASLQINVYKEVPVGQTPKKPSTVNVKLQPANYSGTIVNLSAGWTMDPTTLSGTKIIWQCVGQFDGDGVIIKWDGPIRTTGPQGIPGNDGIRSERMYAVSSTINNPPSVTPVLNMGDDVITSRCGSWYPTLAQATPDGKSTLIQWMLERTSDRFGNWVSNTDRHGWGEPFIFNQFGQGEPGEDGNGVEFVYILSNSETRPPEIFYSKDPNDTTPPEEGESDYQDWDETEFLPWSRETSDYSLDNPVTDYSTGNVTRNKEVIGSTTWVQWTDDPPQADATHKFLWWTLRKKVKKKTGNLFEVITKKKAWTPYCTPTICTRYVVDGSSTRTLDFENDSDYVYYLKGKIEIDSDGVNTGKLTLLDKTGELEIDEVAVTGKPAIGGNQYSDSNSDIIIYSKLSGLSTTPWLKFGDGWEAQVTVEKYDGNNLKVVLLNAKVEANLQLDSQGNTYLKNNILRIPITAHDADNNVTETCIFKIVALEDLSGDGMVWRYKAQPNVSCITKTIEGTKGQELTTTYSTTGLTLKVELSRDSATSTWEPLPVGKVYYVRIVGNKSNAGGAVLLQKGPCKRISTKSPSFEELSILTNDGSDLVEAVCQNNGAYIELYVADDDYKLLPLLGNTGCYLVDREILTAQINYLVSGSDGKEGPQGPQGPQGPSGASANASEILNLTKDNTFIFNSTEEVSTKVLILKGDIVKTDVQSSQIQATCSTCQLAKSDDLTITAYGFNASVNSHEVTIIYQDKIAVWTITLLKDSNKDGKVVKHDFEVSPGSITRTFNENVADYTKDTITATVVSTSKIETNGQVNTVENTNMEYACLIKDSEGRVLVNSDYTGGIKLSAKSGSNVYTKTFPKSIINNLSGDLYIELYVKEDLDLDLADNPLHPSFIYSKNNITYKYVTQEIIPISTNASGNIIIESTSINLSPDTTLFFRISGGIYKTTVSKRVGSSGAVLLSRDITDITDLNNNSVVVSINGPDANGSLELSIADNKLPDPDEDGYRRISFKVCGIPMTWLLWENKDYNNDKKALSHYITPSILTISKTITTTGNTTTTMFSPDSFYMLAYSEENPGHITKTNIGLCYRVYANNCSASDGAEGGIPTRNTPVPNPNDSRHPFIQGLGYMSDTITMSRAHCNKDSESIIVELWVRAADDPDLSSENNKTKQSLNFTNFDTTEEYILASKEVIPISTTIILDGVEVIKEKELPILGLSLRTRDWNSCAPGTRFVAQGDLFARDEDGEKIPATASSNSDEYIAINGFKCNRFYDCVYYPDPETKCPDLYLCKTTHNSDNDLCTDTNGDPIPPNDASMQGYWIKATQYDFLQATTARIDELTSNRISALGILVTNDGLDSLNNYFVAGMINGNNLMPTGDTNIGKTRIFAGTTGDDQNPEKAPFRVYNDGSFYAEKGNFKGIINATELLVSDSETGVPRFKIAYFSKRGPGTEEGLNEAGTYIGVLKSDGWYWISTDCFKKPNTTIDDYNFIPETTWLSLNRSDLPSNNSLHTKSYNVLQSENIGKTLKINGILQQRNGSPIIYTNSSTNTLLYTQNIAETANLAYFEYPEDVCMLLWISGPSNGKYKVGIKKSKVYRRAIITDGIKETCPNPHRFIKDYVLKINQTVKPSQLEVASGYENTIINGKLFADWLLDTSIMNNAYRLYTKDIGNCTIAKVGVGFGTIPMVSGGA